MKLSEKGRVLFLSDLHLAGRNDSRQERLVEFLESKKDDFDTLVIVGDLFDFWMGYKYVIYSEYLPLLAQFERLTKNGTKIVLFEGNHDFFFGSYFKDVLNATVYPGPASMTLGGYKLWICHGDELDPRDYGYKILRWVLRSPFIHWGARFLHPDLLWKIGHWASSHSRKQHKPYAEKRRSAFLSYASDRFAEGYNVILAGHLHDPFLKVVSNNGKTNVVINIGDWLEHKSAVWFRDGRFELVADIERNVSQTFPTNLDTPSS